MNKFIGTGRITADPVLRYTTTGVAVLGFTLAINRRRRNEEGQAEADFINFVAFRGAAEVISNYVKKGDMLGIVGSVQTRNYDDKDGKKVYVTEVIVDEVEFLQPKRKEEQTNDEVVEKTPFDDFGANIEISDDELPF